MRIPDAPVSGTVAGRPFKPEKADFDGQLTLRQGDDFFPDLAVTFYLFLKEGEKLAGKSWTYTGERDFGAPHVHLRFKENGEQNVPESKVFMENYALQLEFGEVGDKGQLPGRIFLEIRDEPGAKLAGTFTVVMPDDLSQQPQDWNLPWVVTRIELPDQKQHSLNVGYVGKTTAGEWESNMAGTSVQDGESGFVASTTYKPRVTTLASSENLGVHGRHVRLSPGKYVFYVTEDDRYLAWKTTEVKADTANELSFQLDPADAGKLTVEVPDAKANQRVEIIPLTPEGQPPLELEDPFDRHHLSRMIDAAVVENGKAQFDRLAPGRYRVYLGEQSGETEVRSEKEAVVKLGSMD